MSRIAALLLVSASVSGSAGYGASLNPRLPDAVEKLDRATVRKLLAGRANPDESQPDGTTALQWAARLDDMETARLLISAGAHVKAANRYGMTALSLACTNG